MTDQDMVVLENVSHCYSAKGDYALKNLSLSVAKNEVLGLLGSNGAGKSTMMNIICGVLNQSEGEVYINGINTKVNALDSKKLIGFLPQKPPLYPELTVEEYLKYAAELRSIPKREIKTAMDKVITSCGLQEHRKRLISNLSGGYQQRVGIAQAIIHSPELVILDEPTTGLDPKQIIEIHKLIRDIANNCTVILSTHILTEVQSLCQHIKMIEQGSLVFEGSAEEFNNYIEPKSIKACFGKTPDKANLETIPGVEKVVLLEKNSFRFHYSNDAENVSTNIVKSSVKNNWDLHEIMIERESLNQVFAELSRKTIN